MEFSDTEVVVDGVVVMQITGEIDLGSAVRLRRRLDSLQSRGRPFVVDLTGVTFLDSSGLKVFDEVQGAAPASAPFQLVCPAGRTLRMFEITGLTDRFSIRDTVEAAVSANDVDG